MALFRKVSAAARLPAELDNLRARRADLGAQLDDAKVASASHTEALHSALIGGAARDDISKLETQLANTERRAAALASALAVVDAKIAATQEQLDQDERRRLAQEQAEALEAIYASFAAKMDAFVQAAADLAPVAEQLSEKLLSAKRLAVIARATATEFPIAKNGLADEARYTREMILQRGSEKPARAA